MTDLRVYELHVFRNFRPWWKFGLWHHRCMVWSKAFPPGEFVEQIGDLRAALSETGWSLEVLPRD